MDPSNFKVLANMQSRSACVTLLPHAPWMQLPNEFLESLLNATQRILVCDLIIKHHQLCALPNNFDQLFSVSVLDLSFNKFKVVPDVLCQLHQLQELFLQHNEITVVPDALGMELHKLNALYLQHNRLTELPIGVCSSSLEILNVDHNQIQEFPEQLEQMKNLKQLHASCNTLESFPSALLKLCNLEELYLSNNNIKMITEICSMTSLKQLHLANNKLQFLPSCIAIMQQLQGLTLTGNKLIFPPLSACRAGVKCLQQYMMEKIEDSTKCLGHEDFIITNLYYSGSDYELESGNESPFEDID